MRLVFSPHAQAEFQETTAYYDHQVSGLGEQFRQEVHRALRRMRQWSLAAPIEEDTIRRMILSRFPYKILYSVEKDCLYIVAIAHMHRKPSYWLDQNF